MTFLARLNRPWLHFIVLGLVLYLLKGYFFPPSKPVIGPLNEARVESLQQQWLSVAGRAPSQEELARMVAAELDRDMLFQKGLEMELHLYDSVIYQRLLRNMRFLGLGEDKSDLELYEQALELRLHLGDEVVKRRVIQVVEQLLLAANPPPAPSGEEIAAEFERRRDELRHPPRYSIQQLYFNRDREAEIGAVVARIADQGLSPDEALELSSPFLPGYRFDRQTPDQLARHFGTAFVVNLQQSNPQPGHWTGPFASTYGQHYVWVSAIEPARDATLEEVRVTLVRDLESRARADALQESIDRLREYYEVKL
jgi:hypothetical protein